MLAIPIWAEMLLGALLGFGGAGLAIRSRPGPKQKLFFIGGAIIAFTGAFLLISKFI